MTYCGERNPNWKGGRTLASSGYYLVKVPGHPMADCRGYAYEHRLVASEKVGRALLPGEQVHHIDGDRLNNSPENLEVIVDLAAHRVLHRKMTGRRMPGEKNVKIKCLCGCGAEILKYDEDGRPRRFIAGHNLHGCSREVDGRTWEEMPNV